MAMLAHYTEGNGDIHTVEYLAPVLARLYFRRQLQGARLSSHQERLLVGAGLQGRRLVEVGDAMDMDSHSTHGNFKSLMRSLYRSLCSLRDASLCPAPSPLLQGLLVPVDVSLLQEIKSMDQDQDGNQNNNNKRSREPQEDDAKSSAKQKMMFTSNGKKITSKANKKFNKKYGNA